MPRSRMQRWILDQDVLSVPDFLEVAISILDRLIQNADAAKLTRLASLLRQASEECARCLADRPASGPDGN